MMRITAENATGINLSGGYLPDLFDLIDKFTTTVDNYTDNTIDDYFISGFTGIEVTEDQSKIDKSLKRWSDRMEKEINPDHILIGSAEDIVTRLGKLEDHGMEMMVSSITVDDQLSSDPTVYFKDKVLSQL